MPDWFPVPSPTVVATCPGTQIAETDVSPIAAGSGFGWVSGTPANAADGATITSVFDLGPLWNQIDFLWVNILSATATSFTALQMFGSDTTAVNASRRLRSTQDVAIASTAYSTVLTASGAQTITTRPMGRYLIISAINTAAGGAQGATAKFVVAAYPRG